MIDASKSRPTISIVSLSTASPPCRRPESGAARIDRSGGGWRSYLRQGHDAAGAMRCASPIAASSSRSTGRAARKAATLAAMLTAPRHPVPRSGGRWLWPLENHGLAMNGRST